MTREEFQTLTQHRVLLDGATGSYLMAHGMPRGVCTEKWIYDNKSVFVDLQRSYVEAGTRIVCAPTFGANRINLSKHNLESQIEEMNHTLVSYSREAVNGKAYIAGDLSTTGKMMEPLGDLTYEEAYEVYREQIQYLADAGVDLLLAETMFNIDETCAAIDAAHSVCDLPMMCSMTVESDGSIFTGGNIIEAAVTLEAAGADAVGINCSVGPDQLVSIVRGIVDNVSIPVIAKPNAGMPTITENGEAIYHMNPEEFAAHMRILEAQGARLIGGCCGTTPEYIKLL